MGRAGIRIAIAVLVVAGVAGYKLFIVDSDEVLNFNDSLVKLLDRSDARFQKLSAYLDQYGNGKKVNIEAMRVQRKELVARVNYDLQKLRKTKAPDDQLCKDFHRNCMAYVNNLLDSADKYEEVIAYMSEHNPGKEADFAMTIELLQPLIEKDQEVRAATIAAQKRLVKKFGLKIK